MEAVEQAKFVESGRRRSEGRIAAASLRLLPDERLAQIAADGNKTAFAAIYERHHQALYRYCRTITRNDEDARDALQASMLNAMRAIGTKPTKLRAWLYRIAHNESISVLRSGKRHASTPLEEVEPSAEAPLESRRELRELLDDIGHLSDRQRQALVMRELGGLGYDEIGDALECSPAAAKQAAFDARGALYELAEARDADCESIRRKISDGDRRLLRARGVRAHLRSCDPCRRFDAALRTRQAKLAGLVPVLSPAASAAVLQSVVGGAGASGTAVAGGAAAGGTAAIGGAAAAGGGGAALGGAAMKGIVAAVAALVATGGAVAVKEQRSEDRDGSGSATQAREGGAPAVSEASTPRTGAAAGGDPSASGSSESETRGGGADPDAEEKSGSGTSNGNAGSAGDDAESAPAGSQPADGGTPHLGPRPPQPGARPPRPGGTGPGAGGEAGLRPGGAGPRPGGSEPAPDGTGGPTPDGTLRPPLDGSTYPLEPRPPRYPTDGTAPSGTRLPPADGE